jgi:1,4-alpha-glucan branching enzyme
MSNSKWKGSIPYEKGCRFAVWAPNADEVFVVGDFNKWQATTNPMTKDEKGWWSNDVVGAKPGDEYRYRIMNAGTEYFRIDPYALQVTNSAGNAIIVEPQAIAKEQNFSPPTLNEMVIYELHIGTFGKQGAAPKPGDVEGVISRLTYLKELGINAIEVMPPAEFAGSFSWGYNPSNIFAVESAYGTPDQFRKFVEEAHKLEIAVIVDVVYNHFGPGDLELWTFDGWSENEKGGIYFYNDWRSNTPWGDSRPDYGRNEVRDYIRDNALAWFQEYGVDGLRWDMTAFIRNANGRDNDSHSDLPDGWSLMQWVNQEIREYKPLALSIAEDLQKNPYITKAQEYGGAGFSAQWSATFVHTIRRALIEADDANRNMDSIRDAILQRYHLDAFERVIYTESHDEVSNGQARIPEEVDPGKASSWAAKKKSTLGAVLVFTAPGIPMIFQGQEFLEDDWFHDDDPIDWKKKDKFNGIHQFYKDLIKLRLNHGGHSKGLTGQEVDVFHIDQERKIIAWHRWASGGPSDSVVVVANFSSNPCADYLINLPASGEWQVRLNSDAKVYDKDFGDVGIDLILAETTETEGQPAQAKINIAPYSAIVLSQGINEN